MTYSQPSPSDAIPSELATTIEECSADVLREISRYADELAEYREREARLEETPDSNAEIEAPPEDLPDDVPSKATLTVKEINNNRYYYWQWRDGEDIKSKYKGPVNPQE